MIQNKKTIIILLSLGLAGIQSCSSGQPTNTNSKITDAKEIISDIKAGKNIFIENKTVSGDLDFTAIDNIAKEGKGLNRSYIRSAITFINCVFTGKITAYKNDKDEITLCDFEKSLTFSECEFKEEVTFRECIVHGNVSFYGTFFIKKTTFEGSRFMGEAVFSKTNYAEELRFQNVFFYNKSNFMDAIFGKTTYFQSCTFYADAQMSNTQWLAYADLSVCTFNAGCYFNYGQFKDKSVFNNTTFAGRAEFLKATFTGNSEFKNCNYYGQVKMYDAIVESNLNFTGSFFLLGIPEEKIFSKSANGKIIFDQVKTGMK